MTDQPAGYYHAEGDPSGTVRYWDGSQWTTGPTSLPPGDPYAAPVSQDRYGGVGARILATIVDGLISLAVVIVLLVITGSDSDQLVLLASFASVVTAVAYLAMVANMGGTPGKLAMGLRITKDDSVTTPPGWGPAILRAIPNLASAIPAIGGLIALVLGIMNIVFVSSDPQRRSVNDRVGVTRVVKKDHLS